MHFSIKKMFTYRGRDQRARRTAFAVVRKEQPNAFNAYYQSSIHKRATRIVASLIKVTSTTIDGRNTPSSSLVVFKHLEFNSLTSLCALQGFNSTCDT
ncbi:hypothetical protein PUN28_006076 [Cardiocondyla obscurior]|uniref:Uncharacterized protein n=1 Tax=Cardiocondyla obscurior TaxID=286306 RepID=A0AAW2G8S6_9HYME